jgi:hypothetical protein
MGALLAHARTFLVDCPLCDYAIRSPCVCPNEDRRPVIAHLVAAIERLQHDLQEARR